MLITIGEEYMGDEISDEDKNRLAIILFVLCLLTITITVII